MRNNIRSRVGDIEDGRGEPDHARYEKKGVEGSGHRHASQKKKTLGGAGRAAAEWTLKARILPFKAVLNNYCFRRNSFLSSSR
jgi:hypothetical protein